MRGTTVLLLLTVAANAAEPGMAPIPHGTFQMGRGKLTVDDKTTMRPQVLLDDRPVHAVTLSAFLLDTHEVTQTQYSEFVKATKRAAPYHWTGGAVPAGTGSFAAYNVTFDDAKGYCEWRGKRLPSEAEWENAARGGRVQQAYPWGDELKPGGRHRCNLWQGRFPDIDTGDDGYIGTCPVNAFEPNGFGLYNMSGNVWEWCADAWSAEAPHDARIIRGGSYLCHASYCNRYRVSARHFNSPVSTTGHMGFRCAADAA